MLVDDALREQFRARLEALRDELRALGAASAGASDTVTLDQTSVGRLSRMDALQMQAMAKASEGRRREQLQRIAGALRRIEAGDFGECARCGEPIAPARLDFDPTATRCVGCADAE